MQLIALRQLCHSRWFRLTLLALLAAAFNGCSVLARSGERVACHIEYGGVSSIAKATAVMSAYDDAPTAVGSDFLFRIVFQPQPAEHAAIKLYTYAAKDKGPSLIHQARFPYPPSSHGAAQFGFTGLQSVYEPLRDGELQYWCEIDAASVRREAEPPGPIRTVP